MNQIPPRKLLDILGSASGKLKLTSLNLEVADFGGANNQGMFLHYQDGQSTAVALSKLQPSELAEREYRFMQWSHDRQLNLTADPVSLLSVNDQLGMLSSSFLKKPDNYLPSAIHSLHWRMVEASASLPFLGSPAELRAEVSPVTPIRKLLNGLVSEQDPSRAALFCHDYIEHRRAVLGANLTERMHELTAKIMISWTDLFESESGLVHGDFKRQNILAVTDHDYRVIDLQYYLQGMRTWDLAFYYSKYEEGFVYCHSCYRGANRIYQTSDESLFVFFYLLASMLKIKPKHRDRILERKIRPALNYFSGVE